MKVELTEHEAHIISEVFEATAYPEHPLTEGIRTVAKDCGIQEAIGTYNLDALFESIWEKTKGD